MSITIKCVRLNEKAKVPTRSRDTDLGYDIYVIADNYDDKSVSSWYKVDDIYQYWLEPGKVKTFRTGIKISTPDNYGFLLRGRSGLATIYGIHVLAGVIEGTYRGEWQVCLTNLGGLPIVIKEGDKIAQAILTEILPSSIIEVNELTDTDRGEKGFGSSGR